MSALKSLLGQAAPVGPAPFFFWIVRDRPPQMRKMGSLLSVIVARDGLAADHGLDRDQDESCGLALPPNILAGSALVDTRLKRVYSPTCAESWKLAAAGFSAAIA